MAPEASTAARNEKTGCFRMKGNSLAGIPASYNPAICNAAYWRSFSFTNPRYGSFAIPFSPYDAILESHAMEGEH
jgi:hypothetical protein